MGLTTPQVVETLHDLGLLELENPGPWPGEPQGESVWQVDWSAVEAPLDNGGDAVIAPEYLDSDRNWSGAYAEILRQASAGPHLPPTDVFDALAWYLPIHNFGYAWAIYVRESGVIMLAAALLSRVAPARREESDAIHGAVRAGLSILYLHEAFHHKVESFAIRLEIIEHAKRYGPYFQDVFGPLRAAAADSDDLLEEALACAEIVRRMRSEPTYTRSIPEDIRQATREMFAEWLPTLPPGYRQAPRYIPSPTFDNARNLLSSQIHEARQRPMRRNDEWLLVPHAYQGLFNYKTVTHILVPIGNEPIIPWFGQPVPALSISSKEMIKLVTGQGYTIVPGGKGSHVKLRAHGRPMIIIPDNREALSHRVLSSVATALDLSSASALVSVRR